MRIMLISHWYFSCCWAVLTLGQGLFGFSYYPASEEAGDAHAAGKEHSQDNWPKLAKGIFYTMSRHAEQENWGELARGWQLLLRGWLGFGQWVVSNCFLHDLFCIFFYHYYYFPFLFCPIKLSVSHSVSYNFFLQNHRNFWDGRDP